MLRNLSVTRWLARSKSVRAVWTSFDVIQRTLNDMTESPNFDRNTKSKAINLTWSLVSVDFVVALMFMKNIMPQMQIMHATLQAEELNIVDAMTIIEGTVYLLRTIRNDEATMNSKITAAAEFLRKVSTEDPTKEFKRKHRRRQAPLRFDRRQTAADVDMKQFYRMEFNRYLDLVITEYGDNLKSCFEKVKPLVVVLKPLLSIPTIEDVEALVEFFPQSMEVDPYVVHAEFSIFVGHIEELISSTNRNFDSLAEIAHYSEERKPVFPLTNRCYQLLMTIPVSVAKDERTFSRLKLVKLVKTSSRSKMGDERLESLLLMSCEKDLTDQIDLHAIGKDWAGLKTRRIQFPK